MSILQHISIEIDEDAVARLMKSNDKQRDAIRELIEEESSNCLPLLAPRITFEEIRIRAVEDDKVFLENGVVFEGSFISKKLAYCSSVVVTTTTLGPAMDDYIGNCFDSGDYLRGMVADNIAITVLGSLGKQLWTKLVEGLKGSDLGITSRLSPGDTDWELPGQRPLFECLRGQDTGITLLESCMMKPEKSSSAVYGIGQGIGITRLGHVCSECKLKNCAYKMIETFPVTVDTGDKKSYDNGGIRG